MLKIKDIFLETSENNVEFRKASKKIVGDIRYAEGNTKIHA